MFTFFTKNILISPKQSRPENSSFNQLLAITYKIHKYFDEGLKLEGFS